MNSCFCTRRVAADAAPPDPSKHVNYVQGMVLGVDDFTQEFAYLSGRDRRLAREAIGYGTLRGLALSWKFEKDSSGQITPKVMVAAGTALTPCGHLVCVPSCQCADINQWLAAHTVDEIAKKLTDAKPDDQPPTSGNLTLHVTLAYSDCPTDDTPIPGEPCRSAEELMQPSLIVDSFQLELSYDAPLQAEEDALRGFYAWLRKLTMVDSGPSTELDKFMAEVRAWNTKESDPASITIKSSDVPVYASTALRLWVTELRPDVERSAARGRTSGNGGYCDDRLLLGTVTFNVKRTESNTWRVVTDPPPAKSPSVDESRRPILIHLRALEAQLIPLPDPGFAGANPKASPHAAPYRRVALGRVKWSSSTAPVGNVRIAEINDGEVCFTFKGYNSTDDYANPAAGKHDYVVHALASYTGNRSEPALRFNGFNEKGIVYKVTRSGNNVLASKLRDMEFQVEVTLIVKPN